MEKICKKILPYLSSTLILLICLSMLYKGYFLNFGYLSIFPSAIFILFIPGYLIYRLLIPDQEKDLFKAISLSFCFSLLVLVPPTFFAYILQLNIFEILKVYLIFVSSLIFILFILDLFLKRKEEVIIEKSEGSKSIKLTLIITFIILAIMGYYFGGLFSGDAYKHVNIIRKMAEMPNIAYKDAYIKDINSSSYGMNPWHLAIAFISKISHLDPVNIWIFLAIINIPVFLSAIFIFLKKLFENEKMAFFAILTYIVWFGIMNYHITEGTIFGHWEFSLSVWPSWIARDIFLYVILFFVFDVIRKGLSKKNIIIISLLSLTMAFVHIYYYYMLLYILAIFLIFLLIFNPYQNRKIYFKKFLIIFLAVLFPAIFYVVYITKSLSPVLNPSHYDPDFLLNVVEQKSKIFTSIQKIGKYYMVNPFDGLWRNNMRKLAFIFAPFLILYARRKDWAAYLLGLIAIPLIVFLNPFLMTWLRHFNPGLDRIIRIVEFIPYEIIVGLFIYKIFTYFWPHLKMLLNKFDKWQVCLFWITIFMVIFLFSTKSFYWLTRIHTTSKFYLNFFNQTIDRKQISNIMPPGSVVLTDQEVGCGWATYFPHYVVTCLGFPHLPPNYDPRPAYNDVVKFYSKEKLDDEANEIIKKYQVDFILIDVKSPLNEELFNDSKNFEFLLETNFEKTDYIKTSGRLSIYKVYPVK